MTHLLSLRFRNIKSLAQGHRAVSQLVPWDPDPLPASTAYHPIRKETEPIPGQGMLFPMTWAFHSALSSHISHEVNEAPGDPGTQSCYWSRKGSRALLSCQAPLPACTGTAISKGSRNWAFRVQNSSCLSENKTPGYDRAGNGPQDLASHQDLAAQRAGYSFTHLPGEALQMGHDHSLSDSPRLASWNPVWSSLSW